MHSYWIKIKAETQNSLPLFGPSHITSVESYRRLWQLEMGAGEWREGGMPHICSDGRDGNAATSSNTDHAQHILTQSWRSSKELVSVASKGWTYTAADTSYEL